MNIKDLEEDKDDQGWEGTFGHKVTLKANTLKVYLTAKTVQSITSLACCQM